MAEVAIGLNGECPADLTEWIATPSPYVAQVEVPQAEGEDVRVSPKDSILNRSSIGVDIGSGSVRAAEIGVSRSGRTLRHFGQVGLPEGAVVAGEILDPRPVVDALRRLWAGGDFSSRKVALALSSQRLIVRRASVPVMSESDLRSALRFQAMDLIPMNIDDAILDFQLMEPSGPSSPGQMSILLAAAHRGVVENRLSVVAQAALKVAAVIPSPVAAIRGCPKRTTEGASAVVDVGADLTVIAIWDRYGLRFSRIIHTGGRGITTRMAQARHVPDGIAESMKRSSIPGVPVATRGEFDSLLSEIDSSLGFFESQLEGESLDSVYLCGGSSRSDEFVQALGERLPAEVILLDALSDMAGPNGMSAIVDLEEFDQRLVASVAAMPIGAALASSGPGHVVSLVPTEADGARLRQRQLVAVTAGAVVLGAGLMGATVVHAHQVHTSKVEAARTKAQNAALQAQITDLAPVRAYTTDAASRQAAVASLSSHDIAWSTLVAEISTAMPSAMHLTSLQLSDGSASASSGPTSGATAPSAASSGSGQSATRTQGSVNMAVTGSGNEASVANWLRSISQVRGLESVWVPSASVGNGVLSFSSTAELSDAAPIVHRIGTSTGAKS